ncbi:MAG TPA: type II secretion system F family protein, partial [Syntrophales bacterium]|nr:type II secretion system F family protein [Syntrophales bacterium]
MAVYLWEGTTRRGELQKGELEAENDSALRIVLRRQGLTNVKIKQKPKDLLEYIPFLRQRVKEKDVVVFSRQFATMINAGLPIIQCLDLLSAEEQNRTFSRIIASVKTDIEQGHSLTDSLKKHPAVFDELFVNLVAAG